MKISTMKSTKNRNIILYILLLSSLFTLKAHAQGWIQTYPQWEADNNIADVSHDYFTQIHHTLDGGYIAYGSVSYGELAEGEFDGTTETLVKLDQFGNVQWSKSFNAPKEQYEINDGINAPYIIEENSWSNTSTTIDFNEHVYDVTITNVNDPTCFRRLEGNAVCGDSYDCDLNFELLLYNISIDSFAVYMKLEGEDIYTIEDGTGMTLTSSASNNLFIGNYASGEYEITVTAENHEECFMKQSGSWFTGENGACTSCDTRLSVESIVCDTDGNGQVNVSIQEPSSSYASNQFLPTDDGGYIMIYNAFWSVYNTEGFFPHSCLKAMKLDAFGNIITETTITTDFPYNSYGTKLYAKPDGNYLILLSNQEVQLITIDQNLNVIEEENVDINSTSFIYIEGLSINEQGEYYLFVSQASQPYKMLKVNATGDTETLWETTATIVKTAMDNNSDLLITGVGATTFNLTAYHIETGEVLWQETLDDFSFEKMEIMPNSELLLVGAKTDNNNHLTAIKLSDTGNIVWEKDLSNAIFSESTSFTIGLSICQDNSFVITGNCDVVPDPDFPNPFGELEIPYVMKLDAEGNLYSSTFCGTIYQDENENCIQDEGELGIPNIVVGLDDGQRFTITDSLGKYCFDVNEGDYSITTILNTHPYWSAACGGASVSIGNNESQESINIGYNLLRECPLMSVSIGAPILRPCLESIYTVQYCNDGTIAEDSVYIEVLLDEYAQLDSADIDYIELSDNFYGFYASSLEANECGSFKIYTTIDCEAPLGATACSEAHVYPDIFCSAVDAAWDGSDISVEATCEGDSIEFRIVNMGDDMVFARSYGIYEDDLLRMSGDFLLNSDEIKILKQEVINGSTYRMEAEESPFYPGESEPQVTVEMCGEGDFSLGFVTTTSPDDADRFIDIDCQEIRVAFDPNDKLVVPSGVGEEHYVLSTDELEYTIRFQNTGNDTAFNIYILDTLSSLLDIHTFESGASSHDYEVEILGNNVVRWQFSDIYLPDSNVNEPASHGFVKFFISPIENIEQYSVIENNAAIYFDFNAPILTEETFVTICDECVDQQYPRYLNAKIFLEGAYQNDGSMYTHLSAQIPTNQPYNIPPYNYEGIESLESIPIGMVDWVLVELRSGEPNIFGEKGTRVMETKAGLLMEDGSIRDVDGESPISFKHLIPEEDNYFCIRHRNHLDILSAYSTMTMNEMHYDFTLGVNQAFGSEQLKASEDGFYMLYGGDYNSDGVIQVTDYDAWVADPAELNTYDNADGNLDGIIQLTDFDLWRKNKAKLGSNEIGF